MVTTRSYFVVWVPVALFLCPLRWAVDGDLRVRLAMHVRVRVSMPAEVGCGW